MARPYFTGNYGSALARVDTRPIIEAGRAQGQMYANMGAQVGGMIQQYGLNKEKRAKLTGEVEALYKEHPELLSQIGMSGDEAQDKKDITEREKFLKNDMSTAQLEGYAGKLARGEVLRSKKLQDDTRRTLNETNKFNLGLQQKLEGTTIELAENEARHRATITRLLNMKEEDRIALGNLPVEQQILALQGSIDEMGAYTGTERGEFAKQSDLRKEKIEEQALKASKQAQGIHDKMIEGMGGLDAYVQFEIEGRKLNHNKIRSSMELMAAQGKTMELNAVARVIAAGNIDLGKKYLDLHSQRGKLMDETLTDSMGGGEITFKEYLKLNGTEGDNNYPLTGPNAGFAGKLNARYKALGLEMQQTIDATSVQADDGSGGAGAQGKVGWMGMNKDHKVGDTFPLDKDSDDPWAGKNVEVLNVDPNTRRTSIKLLDDPRVWASEIQEGINQGESIQRIYNSESNSAKRKWMEQEYGITPTAPPGMGGGYHHPGY